MELPEPAKRLFRALLSPAAAGLSWYRLRGLRARFLLMFYLVTLSAVGLLGYYGYHSATQAYRSKAIDLIAGYTAETANKMDTFQEMIGDDLIYLSTNQSLLHYLYWDDLHDQAKTAYWASLVLNQFQQFAKAYSYDYKIRFIDHEGRERLGVKRDPSSGQVKLIPDNELQDVKDQHYFTRGMKLSKGELYAEAMGPNIEQGQMEKPLVPVVRFLTPVIGDNGVRYGMVALNVLATGYFRYAEEANKIDPHRQFYLVDGDNGKYLFHADSGKTFGHILGHDAGFERDFPGLLQEVRHFEEQHTRSIPGKILSFRHIHPNTGRHENGFILVGVADESAALAELDEFVLMFAFLTISVVVVVFLVSHYYVNGLMLPLEFVTLQLQRLGRGETSREDIVYRAEDEISRMLDSSRRLMVNMERLATQADIISSGDFSGDVPLLSDRDRLGLALNNMTRMLRKAREEEVRSNWLKDNLSGLSLSLTGDLTPQQLADAAISQIGRTLEVGRGAFYRYQKDQALLELLGSYMFVEREALNNRFKLGEGAVGQVARERKPIILHAIDDADPIVTGTLSLAPHHTYTHPLLREGELLGVIEVASFERLDDLKLEFLERATEVMASFLYIVDQHEQIRGLLQISEAATQQAQEQNRRLQDANSLMEEQQQQLQQQTAELQASNAQMEEQQQQLQQQSEELQQTNAQLEEQQQQMQQQASELERKNRDLNHSRDELDQRAKELELASKYKSEFLANMSHELRTPLNSIILLSKMLAMNEEKRLSDEEVKRAAIVHRSGEELLRLINDILDLSKIEAGKMELRPQNIASAELATEFLDLFSATAQDKNLTFTVDDRLQGEFVSDRDKLSQILRNLLSNAFKFTKQGGVTLRMQRSDQGDLPLRLSVIDTGIGIPPDKQHLVFEAFQQVDGSISREFGGTGLGLTISQRIAELLGGVIVLSSREGGGSEFSLCLPMSVTAGNDSTKTVPAQTAEKPAIVLSQPITAKAVAQVHDDRTNLKSSDQVILLIDDDPAFGEALMMLNKRLGYKTLVAASGQEGLRMARAYRPRGILLDLGLPDMDGSEVLHRLKTDRELRHMPVYIVSARDKTQAMLRDGIAGYLQKPIGEGQLADAEADVFARAEHQANGLLLLEGTSLSAESLSQLLQPQALTVTAVKSLPAALEALRGNSYRLAVIDLARDENEADRVNLCRSLREAAADLHLILFSNEALSAELDAALRPYTD
ncbi:MAG: ATP-binding protein, partial [Methylomonas sp.]|nr:ATP-binding protein [Methylomonas sp.]